MADTFIISAEVSANSSETDTLLFKNPANSGVLIICGFHLVGTDAFTSGLLSSLPGTFIHRLYANPTITSNGTALTTINGFITSSPTAAQALVFKNPNISANGSRLWVSVEQGASEDRDLQERIVIDQGNNLLVTATAINPTSMTVRYYFQWKEVGV